MFNSSPKLLPAKEQRADQGKSVALEGKPGHCSPSVHPPDIPETFPSSCVYLILSSHLHLLDAFRIYTHIQCFQDPNKHIYTQSFQDPCTHMHTMLSRYTHTNIKLLGSMFTQTHMMFSRYTHRHTMLLEYTHTHTQCFQDTHIHVVSYPWYLEVTIPSISL